MPIILSYLSHLLVFDFGFIIIAIYRNLFHLFSQLIFFKVLGGEKLFPNFIFHMIFLWGVIDLAELLGLIQIASTNIFEFTIFQAVVFVLLEKTRFQKFEALIILLGFFIGSIIVSLI